MDHFIPIFWYVWPSVLWTFRLWTILAGTNVVHITGIGCIWKPTSAAEETEQDRLVNLVTLFLKHSSRELLLATYYVLRNVESTQMPTSPWPHWSINTCENLLRDNFPSGIEEKFHLSSEHCTGITSLLLSRM